MEPAADYLHAEPAISRDLDGRLSWRERRRHHRHLRHCGDCADFARFQRRLRAALPELRHRPVPEAIHATPSVKGGKPNKSLIAVVLAATAGAFALLLGRRATAD